MADEQAVDTINDNDVLSGRGKAVMNYSGNKQFRGFVEEYRSQYLACKTMNEKRAIFRSVVDKVYSLEPPGRFLKMVPSKNDVDDEEETFKWVSIGDDIAIKKASQALREFSKSRSTATTSCSKKKSSTDTDFDISSQNSHHLK